MVTIELDEAQYSDFLRCLTNLKDICNDVDIRGGLIRQRSNDRTTIFEMNMEQLVRDANIPITNLKKKLDLLKSFAGQAVKIEVEEAEEESDSFYTLSDDFTSIKFRFPAVEFMDNKIMSQDELDSIYDVGEDNLILNNELSSLITERIRIITENFNTQALQIMFEGDMANIVAATQAKDQTAKFKNDININMNFDGRYKSNLSTIPFCIEHDTDLNFKMYKDPERDVSLNKVSTELGSVSIKVFSRSAIIEVDE